MADITDSIALEIKSGTQTADTGVAKLINDLKELHQSMENGEQGVQSLKQQLNDLGVNLQGSKLKSSISSVNSDVLKYATTSGQMVTVNRKVKDGICTKCGSKNIKYGYGKDTQVFISSENLADTITLEGDKDSVKNCLKIKSADELMDAAVAQINPNGTNKFFFILAPLTSSSTPWNLT